MHTVHPVMGTVLVCSPATREPGVRSVLGSFVKVLRTSAPELEIRDVPIDHLPADALAPRPRIAIPLTLSDHDPVAKAVHVERRRDTFLEPAITSHLVDAHREVFLSLARRDPDEAERKMRDHFTIGNDLRRSTLISAHAGGAR